MAGSTLTRRALGRQLHTMRKLAGITQNQAARMVGISPQTMARWEEGISPRSANDLFVNALCDRYGVPDEKRRIILDLAKEVRAIAKHGGGWWRADSDRSSSEFDPHAILEDSATRVTSWRIILLPKIVQVPGYCRAVAWTESPNLPSDHIERRVEESLKQQQRLDDPGFTARIFLSEAAIREEWGGPAVMDEQRRYLAEVGRRPNISIRVVPFNSRRHIGALVGSFSLMEFPILPRTRFTEPPIVYIEEYVGDLYLERSEEVSRYKEAIAELQRVALDEEESRRRILAISEEYGTGSA
ncbi:helix-turn-helix domain-containing protein [Nocardia sp. NPDC003482]